MRRTIRRCAAVALAAALAAVPACAYFNTLYNANKLYAEAEKARGVREGEIDKATRDKYDAVVTKCSQVVQNYPDSRWVDDAVLLMGKALVRREEYDKGIRKFVELATNFPQSEHVPEAHYWQALAQYEKGDLNAALLQTERFLSAFPGHDLRFDVLFLAGDISLALEEYGQALERYELVAKDEDAGDRRRDALRRSADLHYRREDWAAAAEAYDQILGKGMDWKDRYDVSLALAGCYTKTGRCAEALDLQDRLLREVTQVKEKPPVILGRAASFVCMDSLATAMAVYRTVIRDYPRSNFSAEAYYRLGVIYQERFDSLQAAQEAYSKVSSESAISPFAPEAIQKGGSLKRLLELEAAGGDEDEERRAEKRFLAAEIQLTRLGEVDLALGGYRSVVDSFPGSRYAPQSAYAVGYIHERQKGDTARAIEAFEDLARRWPASPQAFGALERIDALGAPALRLELASYVDSARAWADSVAALAPPDTAAAAPPVPAPQSPGAQAPPPQQPAAPVRGRPPQPQVVRSPADSAAASRPAEPDTSSPPTAPSVPDTSGAAGKEGR